MDSREREVSPMQKSFWENEITVSPKKLFRTSPQHIILTYSPQHINKHIFQTTRVAFGTKLLHYKTVVLLEKWFTQGITGIINL